jgi:hypothetical protein
MKGRAYWLMWGVIFAVGLILGSAGVFAETVEINTAQTSMQDLEALSGGRTKTALVTSSGSVNVSSGTAPANLGQNGWLDRHGFAVENRFRRHRRHQLQRSERRQRERFAGRRHQ